MLTVRTFILWIHLAAIVVWVGGMVTVPFVAAPVVRRHAGPEAVTVLVRRFQRLSRELILLVLLTGIFNLILVGMWARFQFSTPYLTLVGAKLLLFFVMIANQFWYSYRLAPPLEASRKATWSAIANVIFAAAVIYLGLSLRAV